MTVTSNLQFTANTDGIEKASNDQAKLTTSESDGRILYTTDGSDVTLVKADYGTVKNLVSHNNETGLVEWNEKNISESTICGISARAACSCIRLIFPLLMMVITISEIRTKVVVEGKSVKGQWLLIRFRSYTHRPWRWRVGRSQNLTRRSRADHGDR